MTDPVAERKDTIKDQCTKAREQTPVFIFRLTSKKGDDTFGHRLRMKVVNATFMPIRHSGARFQTAGSCGVSGRKTFF
ncbi:MAG: hypothetical protein PHF57_02315, partial [Methanoregula sp.]|nr:hypothetical protein [Methanoregula sp.]